MPFVAVRTKNIPGHLASKLFNKASITSGIRHIITAQFLPRYHAALLYTKINAADVFAETHFQEIDSLSSIEERIS